MSKNPVQVDMAKDLIRLRKQRKKARKFNMIHELSQFKKEEKDRYRGEGIFIKSIGDFDYNVKNRVSSMQKELEYFSQKECEIIMKLRTECINLC